VETSWVQMRGSGGEKWELKSGKQKALLPFEGEQG
jgi:hypothetical protein